jgi:hypothetical protein
MSIASRRLRALELRERATMLAIPAIGNVRAITHGISSRKSFAVMLPLPAFPRPDDVMALLCLLREALRQIHDDCTKAIRPLAAAPAAQPGILGKIYAIPTIWRPSMAKREVKM